MPSSFSRSIRSIRADKFDISLVTTITAVALISVWIIWFFFADITIYIESRSWSYKGNGYVQVELSTEEMQNIHNGQYAIIVPDGEIKEDIGVIDAFVNDIDRGTTSGTVELYTRNHYQILDNLQEQPTGIVRIKIETASPAQLILRAMGQTTDTPNLVTNPN